MRPFSPKAGPTPNYMEYRLPPIANRSPCRGAAVSRAGAHVSSTQPMAPVAPDQGGGRIAQVRGQQERSVAIDVNKMRWHDSPPLSASPHSILSLLFRQSEKDLDAWSPARPTISPKSWAFVSLRRWKVRHARSLNFCLRLIGDRLSAVIALLGGL